MKSNTTIKIPEITAKAYAEINGLSREKVNDMCLSQELPCRKIGVPPKDGARDGRIWWINLSEIERQVNQ